MNITSIKLFGNRMRWLKRLFGASALFMAAAVAGQAQSVYPEVIKPMQSPDVLRPCTHLEKSAKLAESECGTLTLADVHKRLAEIENWKPGR